MQRREFPVLAAEDAGVVEEFGVGLPRDAARVLAYLALREADPAIDDGAATRLAVRVGTGLGRGRSATALSDLEERDLVTATAVRRSSGGRPPKAWRVADGRAATAGRVRRQRAESLLDLAGEVASVFEADLDCPGTGRRADDDRSLRVALNWTPNGLQAPLFVAAERGSYRDHGLDVDFEAFRGSGAALAAVAAGEADLALSGAATLCRADAGEVLPLALVYQRATTALYARAEAFDGGFDSVEQLRGRRIAMAADSEPGTLARLFLSQAGVVDDVTVVETAGEERELLRSGAVDVATGVAADPDRLAADGRDVESMLVADRFPVPGPALVARADRVGERREALVRFLAGTMAGWTAARRDPAAAAEVVAAESDDPPAAERRQFERALDRFTTGEAVRRHGWGHHDRETWERLRVALSQAGVRP